MDTSGDLSPRALKRILLVVIIVDAVVAFAVPLWNHYVTWNNDAPLQCGAALVAVLTFLGFWAIGNGKPGVSGAEAVRDATASAFVVVYLVIVSWSSFFNYLVGGEEGRLSPLTSSFVANFTWLTGVVITFYFGASAVTEYGARRGDTRVTSDSTSTPAEPVSTASAPEPRQPA